MSRIILLFTSVIVVTLFTFNSFWLQFKGHSTIQIIDRLPILFAPTNFTYYIWVLVFIFLFLWIYNYVKLRRTDYFISIPQVILFLCVVIFQIASLWSWHSEQFVISFVLLFIQVILLFRLYLTYPLKKEIFKIRIPIAVYFSWSTYLLILHGWYLLVDLQWKGFGLSSALWTVILMTIGTAIALHLRYHHFDIAYPLVMIWCYLGIAISNGFDELLVTTAALFLIGVLVVGIFFMKKNPAHLK